MKYQYIFNFQLWLKMQYNYLWGDWGLFSALLSNFTIQKLGKWVVLFIKKYGYRTQYFWRIYTPDFSESICAFAINFMSTLLCCVSWFWSIWQDSSAPFLVFLGVYILLKSRDGANKIRLIGNNNFKEKKDSAISSTAQLLFFRILWNINKYLIFIRIVA